MFFCMERHVEKNALRFKVCQYGTRKFLGWDSNYDSSVLSYVKQDEDTRTSPLLYQDPIFFSDITIMTHCQYCHFLLWSLFCWKIGFNDIVPMHLFLFLQGHLFLNLHHFFLSCCTFFLEAVCFFVSTFIFVRCYHSRCHHTCVFEPCYSWNAIHLNDTVYWNESKCNSSEQHCVLKWKQKAILISPAFGNEAWHDMSIITTTELYIIIPLEPLHSWPLLSHHRMSSGSLENDIPYLLRGSCASLGEGQWPGRRMP